MNALDLFCGAGGASMGISRAGFKVFGVDREEQKEYPFHFTRWDALTIPAVWSAFDLIWASPPCQFASAYRRRGGNIKPALNLIPATRDLLLRVRRPYIIENVEGAHTHAKSRDALRVNVWTRCKEASLV